MANIKYLYNMGVQQSYQVDTVAGFSILAFHDCAELFLLLAAEHEGIKDAYKMHFMDFWDKIPILTLRESMNALKDRRVNIKHKGLFPSKSDIEISRITMTNFLEENTLSLFGIKFSDIRMSVLVANEDIRIHIDEAEKIMDEGNFYESLVKSKIAFKELLFAYESNKRAPHFIKSHLEIGEEIGKDYHYLVDSDSRSGARWFEQVTETTNKIRDVLKITALGIDFKKYSFFEAVTPRIVIGWGTEGRKYINESLEQFSIRHKLRKDDCRFCIDFVIDSALKLQEFDYDIKAIFK